MFDQNLLGENEKQLNLTDGFVIRGVKGAEG